MFYLGIIFFLIGAWQAFMNGRLSPMISGISLILGAVFVFIGDWHAGLFFIFMFATWFLLMQIFRFSTYHGYFFKAAIFLIAYAVLIGFLLSKLGFQDYFWWYLILSFLFLGVNHRKQWQSKKMLSVLSEKNKEPDVVSMFKHKFDFNEFIQMKSFTEGSKPEEIELSLNRTIKYHLLSSIIFIVAFVASVLYFASNLNF